MSHTCSCCSDHASHGEAATPLVTRLAPPRHDAAAVTVAEAKTRPGALPVLERLGINHCCGGHLTLGEAAAAAGVPVDTLLAALEEAAGARA